MSERRFPLEKLGLWLTAAYLTAIAIAVACFWKHFAALSPNEWGDFLAGTFGPLALAWIVLGFFLQSRELQHSVDALRLQAEELKNSVQQQKAMVNVSNEQLSIEIETRDRLKQQQEEANKPFFVLTHVESGHLTIGSADHKNVDLIIQNLGGPARHVELMLEESRINAGSLGTGERKALGTKTIKTTLGAAIVRGKVRCVDLQGQTRTQELESEPIGR